MLGYESGMSKCQSGIACFGCVKLGHGQDVVNCVVWTPSVHQSDHLPVRQNCQICSSSLQMLFPLSLYSCTLMFKIKNVFSKMQFAPEYNAHSMCLRLTWRNILFTCQVQWVQQTSVTVQGTSGFCGTVMWCHTMRRVSYKCIILFSGSFFIGMSLCVMVPAYF